MGYAEVYIIIYVQVGNIIFLIQLKFLCLTFILIQAEMLVESSIGCLVESNPPLGCQNPTTKFQQAMINNPITLSYSLLFIIEHHRVLLADFHFFNCYSQISIISTVFCMFSKHWWSYKRNTDVCSWFLSLDCKLYPALAMAVIVNLKSYIRVCVCVCVCLRVYQLFIEDLQIDLMFMVVLDCIFKYTEYMLLWQSNKIEGLLAQS